MHLPTLNAILNGTAAVLLMLGWLAIKRGRRIERHRNLMIAALVASAAFLVFYLYYHYLVGSVPYPGRGILRGIYLAILIPHIILAGLMGPFIVAAVILGLMRWDRAHVAITRWLWPVWMYVSVTGVLIYLMLYVLPHNGPEAGAGIETGGGAPLSQTPSSPLSDAIAPGTEMVEVNLYYFDPAQHAELLEFQSEAAVVRSIPKSDNLLEDTLRLLLRNELTEEEKARGLVNPLDGSYLQEKRGSFRLVSAEVRDDGIAVLTFEDPEWLTTGPSSRREKIWTQIANTTLQFPEVKGIEIRPEDLFSWRRLAPWDRKE